ncbi:MAG: response regulator [Phycisphaerae bacterium]
MGNLGIISIVEDDPGVRDLLCRMLEGHDRHCQCYGCAHDFLNNYDPRIPGCLILDLRLPDGDGIDMLREVRRRGWHVPTIILTAFGGVSSAVSAMKLGVLDYLEKPFHQATLVAKVIEALTLDQAARRQAIERGNTFERFAELTQREHELLKLLIAGKSNKEVARIMGVAIKTVKNHRAHLMHKVRAANTADLVRMATTAGVDNDGSAPQRAAHPESGDRGTFSRDGTR